MNLFKGKRSTTELAAAFFEEETPAEGDALEGKEEELPEWLADAIEQGAISMPDDAPDLDVPHRDVGQDKPFTF